MTASKKQHWIFYHGRFERAMIFKDRMFRHQVLFADSNRFGYAIMGELEIELQYHPEFEVWALKDADISRHSELLRAHMLQRKDQTV